MRRSYEFLLRPTGKQAAALAQCLEDHRVLYNAALEHADVNAAVNILRAGLALRDAAEAA
ncbi:helix-turn-helix domain-containing protein [Sphaerimonospora cavernae]|uniref:Helix-turn-helix domain-containing protein n=1 Tax=Sphaerimonospora cavernae TaxID=1740611 RepID=A0ABV6U7P4_9ACTN